MASRTHVVTSDTAAVFDVEKEVVGKTGNMALLREGDGVLTGKGELEVETEVLSDGRIG
jgi:hypothetical protein